MATAPHPTKPILTPGVPPKPDMQPKQPPGPQVDENAQREMDAGKEALKTHADRLKAEQEVGRKALERHAARKPVTP